MKQLRTLNDAMEFIHGTFYYAGLNLNPDLGFLKADNTSAFPKLTDKGAQKSQAYLVQAEEILRKENMDIWEVCMEMSIYITTHAWAEASLAGSKLESAEWLEYLRTKHDGIAEMRIMAWPIEEETKEDREFRRASFLFDTIETSHRMHPAIAQSVPNSWDLGNGQRASFLCVSLLPPNWQEQIDEAMRKMGGRQAGDDAKFELSLQDGAEQFQGIVDEITQEYGEQDIDNFDDDPTKGMDW